MRRANLLASRSVPSASSRVRPRRSNRIDPRAVAEFFRRDPLASQDNARQRVRQLLPTAATVSLTTSTSFAESQSVAKLLASVLRATNSPGHAQVAAMRQALSSNKAGIVALLSLSDHARIFEQMGLNSGEVDLWVGLAGAIGALFQGQTVVDVDSVVDTTIAQLRDQDFKLMASGIDGLLVGLDLAKACGMSAFIQNFNLGAFEEKRALFEQTMSQYYGAGMALFLKKRVLAGMLDIDLSVCKTNDELALKRTGAAIAHSGSFMNKLFQKIGSDTDMPVLKELMSDIKNNLPPMSLEDVNQRIKNRVRNTVDVDYSKTKVLRAASIGQTAIITLKNGEKFIVKMLKPDARKIADWERTLMMSLPLSKSDASMVSNMFDTIAEEMDFRIEASNTTKGRELYTDPDRCIEVVPMPFPKVNAKDFMIQGFAQGAPLDTFSKPEDLLLRGEALANFLRKWLTVALDTGFFHGDPHQGNILARKGEVEISVQDYDMDYDICYFPTYHTEKRAVLYATPIDFGACGHMTEAEIEAAKWFGVGIYRQDAAFMMESLQIIHGLNFDASKPGLAEALAKVIVGKDAMRDVFLTLEKYEVTMPRSFVLFFWSYDYFVKQLAQVNQLLKDNHDQPINSTQVQVEGILGSIWNNPGRSAYDVYTFVRVTFSRMIENLVE